MAETLHVKKTKGHIRCNSCRSECSVRNGDWFFSIKADSTQQIFLCKKCESALKNLYKRVNPIR